MTNLLLELIENKVEHFITKSYVTCGFEDDEYRTEYYVYYKIEDRTKNVGFYNKRSSDFPFLKYKKLQSKELRFFFDEVKKYLVSFEDENGSVFVNKDIGFTKKEKSSQKKIWED